MKIAQFTCPVTKKKSRADESGDVEVEMIADAKDGVNVPLAWGRVTIDIAVENPEVAKVEAQRAGEKAKALEDMKKVVDDPKAPRHYRERAQAQIDDPRDVDQAIAAQLPLPEHDVVWRRVTYPVLSDEALTAFFESLKALGFPQGGE